MAKLLAVVIGMTTVTKARLLEDKYPRNIHQKESHICDIDIRISCCFYTSFFLFYFISPLFLYISIDYKSILKINLWSMIFIPGED